MVAFLLTLSVFLTTPTLQQVRELYRLSAQNEEKCRELIQLLEKYNEHNHPLYSGYRASAVMLMATYTSNPFQKLSYFNKGKRQLEAAVNNSKDNIELRCLRFAVQSNIPSFLGYKDHLAADKQFILRRYAGITDNTLRKNIRYFMEQWGNLTATEKALL